MLIKEKIGEHLNTTKESEIKIWAEDRTKVAEGENMFVQTFKNVPALQAQEIKDSNCEAISHIIKEGHKVIDVFLYKEVSGDPINQLFCDVFIKTTKEKIDARKVQYA